MKPWPRGPWPGTWNTAAGAKRLGELASSRRACLCPGRVIAARATLARELGLAGEVSWLLGRSWHQVSSGRRRRARGGEAVIPRPGAPRCSPRPSCRPAHRPPSTPASIPHARGASGCSLPSRSTTSGCSSAGVADTWAAAEAARPASSGRDPYEVILSGGGPRRSRPHLNGAGTPTCDALSIWAPSRALHALDRPRRDGAGEGERVPAAGRRAAGQPGEVASAGGHVRRVRRSACRRSFCTFSR